jgi:hypothetical protein
VRINPEAGFAHLFQRDENRIMVAFKLFNGQLELFYKEDEQSLFFNHCLRGDQA